jgi:succinoglycan biosynthesis transport protein ExoP
MQDDPTRALPNSQRTPTTPLGAMLRDLWRYKLVVPAVAVIAVGIVAFWVVRQPKIYAATATLEYDASPSQPLGSKMDDVANASTGFWDTQEFYATQNLILKSRGLAERVAQELKLQDDEDFWSLNPAALRHGRPTLQRTAVELLRFIEIAPVRDTRVVRISVRDHNPARAQRIANTWVEAYLDRSLEDRLGTTGRALEWLSTQMSSLKRELGASELALYKFREQHHSLSASLEERRKIIAGQLQSYSETLTAIHAKYVQTEARLSVVRETLEKEQDLLSVSVGPVVDNATVAALRNEYREASEQLQRLSITYGEAHPDVRAAAGRVDAIMRQLRAQVEALVAGIEAELLEYQRAEQGILAALDQVNRQGLELSLQEIDYSRLEREKSSKMDIFNMVMQRAAQTDLTRALRVANGRVVDTALKPTVPVSPRVTLAITLAAVAGLVLGVLAALGIATLDNKVRSPADVEAIGMTLLGILPTVNESAMIGGSYGRKSKRRSRIVDSKQRDLLVHLEPRSSTAECCRTIRTNITFQGADKPLRTLAITSAMPRDGKSTVAVSIATILAQSGKRVLLVDTDLRKPRLHRVFGLHVGPGATTILAGESTLDEVRQTTDIPGVTLLQCGPIPPNPAELLYTRRFADLVSEARAKYDLVVFDTPPIGAVTDPAVIGPQVDGTIVVVRSGTTPRAAMEAAVRQLRGVGARITGIVLNDVDLTDSRYGTYYAYYRGYYQEDDNTSLPPSTKPNSESIL